MPYKVCLPPARSINNTPEHSPMTDKPVRSVRDGEATKSARKIFRGVKIWSEILNDHIWLIFDRSFTPNDGLACYYENEIQALKTKTKEELCKIHKFKLAFPGCVAIQ